MYIYIYKKHMCTASYFRRPPTSLWDGQRAIVTHPRLHGTGNAKSCDRHETTSQCIQCDAFCSAGGPTGGKELRENSKEMSSLLSTRLLKASSGAGHRHAQSTTNQRHQ